nr:MAG TPA: hypothetical protein [Caudoviricetes sp.]
MATKKFVSKDNLSRVWTRLFGKVLNSKEEIEANTSENMIAGAEAVKEVYSSLTDQPTFEYDESGKITGYKTKIGGADTVFPFKNVVYLGDGTTFNVSSYKDYRKFTLNNFVASSFDTTTAGGVNVGTAGASAHAQIIKSYDNTTGILTFKIRSTVIGYTQSPFAEGKANGVYLILM